MPTSALFSSLPLLVPLAYVLGVVIWSTTPLGIVWSSETVHPTLAVLLRTLIGLVLGIVLLVLLRIRLPLHRQAWLLYGYSTIGVVGGMLLTFLAAPYIGSGVMSLIFGLAPILSGLIGQKLLNEAKFTRFKLLGFAVAFSGLGLVCKAQFNAGADSLPGILLVLCGVSLFSFSAVLVKKVQIQIHPLASTVGSLLVSTPIFALVWLIADGTLPTETWSERSLYSILYLGIFGSLIASMVYFYIMQHLAASTVTMVTLITPGFAVMLGATLNHEPISSVMIGGACLVLCGLGVYLFGDKLRQANNKDS